MSKSDFGPHSIDTFPSESDSGTMRKVLKWGVIPLNLEGHGMDPHSFSWASTNSPVNIRRFNSSKNYALGRRAASSLLPKRELMIK